MADVDPPQMGSLFYTGASRFLKANEHFVRALVSVSSHCSIHASEDIFDAHGLKLWARGKPIDERLLERLSDRKLRKPIELCVYAADPIATAGIAEAVQAKVTASEPMRVLLEPHLEEVLNVVGGIVPNPTELMLLSVMRHDPRDMLGHAALVTALALVSASLVGLAFDEARNLARAALLHDVGELYLPPTLFEEARSIETKELLQIRNHVTLGTQIAIELARSGLAVAQLIALSHERLDGSGYPRGLKREDLPLAGQAMLFSEAVARMLDSGPNGLRRAALAANLAPAELPPDMVAWLLKSGMGQALVREADLSGEHIGLGLRQIHAVLARVIVLLNVPRAHESDAVRAAAQQWLTAAEVLLHELRRAGIEQAIFAGLTVDPQSDAEAIELSVLSRELLHRIRELSVQIELAKTTAPELASSDLVLELLEALRASEPKPSQAISPSSIQIELLPWSNLYCVGVEEIDKQHRVLVGLLNRLAAAGDDASNSNLVSEILVRLVQYAREHFVFEERLMQKHRLTDVESHVAAHRSFVERVAQMANDLKHGVSPTPDALTGFLRQWLISHILFTDKALGAALNAKGVR